MLPDHAVPGFQLDLAMTADDHLARPALHRNQIDTIAVMVGVMQLLRAALDLDRPAMDTLLPRPVLRREFQLLQSIADRRIILITGGMFDAQFHSTNL